jgi:hypothetical protein
VEASQLAHEPSQLDARATGDILAMSIHGWQRDAEDDLDMQRIGDQLSAVGISNPFFLRADLKRLFMVAEDIGILLRARGIGDWQRVADVAASLVRQAVERGYSDDTP